MNEQGSEVIHHLTSLSLRWFICKMKSLKRLSLRVFYLWHALSLTCSKCLLILYSPDTLQTWNPDILTLFPWYFTDMKWKLEWKWLGKTADHVMITVQINMLALIPWRNWNRIRDMSAIAKCRNQMGCFISGTPRKMTPTLVLPCFSLQLSCQCLGLGLGGHEVCRGPASVSTHSPALLQPQRES